MPTIGTPVELTHKDEFIVQIPGFADSTWTLAGPMGYTHALVKTHGAAGFYDVDVGVSEPKDITITRPLASANMDFYNWHQACLNKTAERFKNVTLVILNRDGTQHHNLVCTRAVVGDYEGFSGDAKSSTDAAEEKVTIAVQSWYDSRNPPS